MGKHLQAKSLLSLQRACRRPASTLASGSDHRSGSPFSVVATLALQMGCGGSKPEEKDDKDKDKDAAAAEIQAAAQLFLQNQGKKTTKDDAAEDIQEMAAELFAKQDP